MNIFELNTDPHLLKIVLHNRFMLIMFVIFLMRAKYATYRNIWLCALVEVPGTLMHELAHLIVGFVTFSGPCRFSIWPKSDGKGNYIMGSVGFRNIKFFNAIPSAMAPLSLLPIGFWLNSEIVPYIKPSISNYILYIALQTIIIENALPSRTDFRVAFKFPLGILLYGSIAVYFCFFYESGFLSFSIPDFNFGRKITGFISNF